MAKYTQLAADILKAVGGPENIGSLTHCMTRLRMTLKDMNRYMKKSFGWYQKVIATNGESLKE